LFSLPTLFLPAPAGMSRIVVGAVGVLAIVVGILVWFAPWDRWPWWSTLWLVPMAFALLSVSNAFSGYQPYAYSIFYVVIFVWIGVAYPARASLWFSPLAALSYILPLMVLPGNFAVDASSAALVIPTCVMVGEVLAWGRKRVAGTEEDLRESKERARKLSDAAFEAIILHEGNAIIEANSAFGQMFRYQQDEIPGLSLSALGLDAGVMSERPGEGHWQQRETELRRKDGTTFAAEVAGRRLPYEGRTVRVTVIRDVTAHRQAMEKEHAAAVRLRTLDEMKNTFLNAVSHELRTPLAAVLGSSLTLERLGLDLSDQDQRDLLHAVTENARKLERMLTDLLDLDRLTRGVLEIRRLWVDLGALVRRVVEGSELGDHRVEVRAESFRFPVDGPKVERIVENLVANAAKYTARGCSICVRVEQAPEGALIVVEDNGPGVPSHLRSEIFEPFHQGANARGDSPGVGIGLSLVARFAELHGGKAWVEEGERGGASFRVLLKEGAAGANHELVAQRIA
jgi:PAS domain S-box-containing protein